MRGTKADWYFPAHAPGGEKWKLKRASECFWNLASWREPLSWSPKMRYLSEIFVRICSQVLPRYKVPCKADLISNVVFVESYFVRLAKHYSVKPSGLGKKVFFPPVVISLLLIYGTNHEGLRAWLKGRDKG